MALWQSLPPELRVNRVRVGAFTIPTDSPESDGTLEWRKTTLVVVELRAARLSGLGFTYAHAAAADLLRGVRPKDLPPLADPADSPAGWLRSKLRNDGPGGLVARAASALDVAWWDLRGRVLGLPVTTLLRASRSSCPVYGSGGFTSYSNRQLRRQFAGWAEQGITRFKMKVGRSQAEDPGRVRAARAEIGPGAELFVDANSAYDRGQALHWARCFARESRVSWLEEPLSPDDLSGLRALRAALPARMDLAEGEYATRPEEAARWLDAKALDVLMPDATRCGGVTGFLEMARLAAARRIPVSSHCAPGLHAHLGCAVRGLRHAEYFHDHARIERRLFEGMPVLRKGALLPPIDQPGFGWAFKWRDAARFAS